MRYYCRHMRQQYESWQESQFRRNMNTLHTYLMNRLCSLPARAIQGVGECIHFLGDAIAYSRLEGAEKIELRNLNPRLFERTGTTRIEPHYFYLSIWAARRVLESGCSLHVDVGSLVQFVAFLTCFTRVVYIDIRPLAVELKNLECRKGSILEMPFPDNSVESLSCLHVAEHIGLGRYGDPLNARGTAKAAEELARVLSPGGRLYFAVPIGRPRLCFNAHRIHSSAEILQYFGGLKLAEYSGVDDTGRCCEGFPPEPPDSSSYACGFFIFTKPHNQAEQ